MTASYTGVTQTNTTSFSSPTTSFSSSSATHEVSIVIERRFVSIETTLQQHQKQQDAMTVKLDSLDEKSTESNVMLKQMMDQMNLTSITRGEKRGKLTEDEAGDQDEPMSAKKLLP
eukprot:CAMPEP_0172436734 /NCGR_PEP_ID=MMETSP1064-20121228/71880_1 /TAXON_ID=202472 /ORGANISM="Aulacoseira subarctica , Strain CCAP 1002/5" /LENGTH=115 /DNA_ID=CAMNT_0013185157 /DNA_START=1750 /DNA_END=2097 /DNA_ORIENTATION=+